jgi:signal transduction histidine kinase
MSASLQSYRPGAGFDTNRTPHTAYYANAMEHLVQVVQDLSHARDLDTITEIVRDAARELTSADGATFVLRENDNCYYADENAIAPLWKGRRFPMSTCISGWVMLNAKAVVLKDIYSDSRIPANTYRPTFVKSLAMVPIRKAAPIGAIGVYWAQTHEPAADEVAVLQALADTTSVALENVDLYSQLQAKIAELESSNYELSCFAWAASHDLQSPLRTIVTQVEMLQYRCKDKLDEKALAYIRTATDSAGRLQRLIHDLLVHAQAGKSESFKRVELTELVLNAYNDLQVDIEESGAQITYCTDIPAVSGNPHLLECLFRNLISNAIKFRTQDVRPQIKITSRQEGNEWLIAVTDNGLGIESAYQERIFGLFQRLHSRDIYEGSGIGLSTCRKIVEIHGGRIWVESAPAKGSVFCFTLPILKMQEH